MENSVKEILRRSFKPEFLNRLDETIMFRPLGKESIRRIIELLIADVNKRLDDRDITVSVSDAAADHIADEAFEPAYGARPLKRYIQKYIETAVATEILKGTIDEGDAVMIDSSPDGQLMIKK